MQDQPAQSVNPVAGDVPALDQSQPQAPSAATAAPASPSLTPPPSYVDAYVPPAAPVAPAISSTPAPSIPASHGQAAAPHVTLTPTAPTSAASTPSAPSIPKPAAAPVSMSQTPAVTSSPASSATMSQDSAQSTLDELTKMLDQVEEPASQSAAAPAKPNPTLPPSPTLPPVSEPMTTQPSNSLPQEPTTDLKSSEDLLAEIEQALNDKKPAASNQPPMPSAGPSMSSDSMTPKLSIPPVPPPPTMPKPMGEPVMPPVPPAPAVAKPPVAPPPAAPTELPVATGAESEKLEDQNIFYLLGVDNNSSEQKEQFLDELQQVIWEDFLDHDIELLLTEKEHTELKTRFQLDSKKPLAEQEEVIAYLENLIPDLENLMMEKAIRLKADLVKERVTGLREKLTGQNDKLAELDKADGLIAQEKWLSAAKVLNQLAS